jgi:hypothetical protein
MEDDINLFDSEINELVNQLKSAFNSTQYRWFLHEQTDTLYVELSGLELLDDDYIEKIASPILDELELEFEEIILLPYSE